MTTQPKTPTSMPVIAGVLILVSVGIKLLFLLVVLFGSVFFFVPTAWEGFNYGLVVPVAMLPLLALAAVAVIGGIFSIQKRNWGWALAGAIITSLPFSFLGLAAVVLLALSKDEFN